MAAPMATTAAPTKTVAAKPMTAETAMPDPTTAQPRATQPRSTKAVPTEPMVEPTTIAAVIAWPTRKIPRTAAVVAAVASSQNQQS